MLKGKGKKKADTEKKDSNQSPNVSEPIEQDSFELEVRDMNIDSVRETLSRFFNDRHDLQGTEEKLCVTYAITIGHWIKAYRVRRAAAANTAKVLVKDFIPHYGLPDQICSDNVTHFTGAFCAEVRCMLNITWSFHCPYHPQWLI